MSKDSVKVQANLIQNWSVCCSTYLIFSHTTSGAHDCNTVSDVVEEPVIGFPNRNIT